MTAHLGGSGSPAECLLPSCSTPSAIVGVYGHSTAYARARPCSDAFRCGLNGARFLAQTTGSILGLAFAQPDLLFVFFAARSFHQTVFTGRPQSERADVSMF